MKIVWLSDEQAVELNLRRFIKLIQPRRYYGGYDARRVKRARRAAHRYGFARNGGI